MSVMSNQGEGRGIERQNAIVGGVFWVAGGLPGVTHVKPALCEPQTFARSQTRF